MYSNYSNIIAMAPYTAFLLPLGMILAIYFCLKKEPKSWKILALLCTLFSCWCCMRTYEGLYYMIVRIH